MNIAEYLEKINKESQAIFIETIKDTVPFGKAHHLGNVLVVVSDKKLQHSTDNVNVDYYLPDVTTATDYYPGGMQMPGRTYNIGAHYRYGFNGKEKLNEIEGSGNAYDFGDRIQDPRIVRWFSIDKLQAKHPSESPYLYTGGNPIYFIDPDGKDRVENNIYMDKNGKIIGRMTVCKTTNSWDIISKKTESSSSIMGGGSSQVIQLDWYNIGYNVIHVIDENGKEISKTTGNDYAFGSVLTTTGGEDVLGEGKLTAGTKIYASRLFHKDEYEGVALYAENGQGQETKVGQYTKEMAEVSGLLKATGTTDEVGAALNIVDKIHDLVEEKKAEENAKENDSKQVPAFYKNVKPGSVVNFGPSNAKKINDSTWSKDTNAPATDTSPVWKGEHRYDPKKPINLTTPQSIQ
jgi:RHS repeat-associated protein